MARRAPHIPLPAHSFVFGLTPRQPEGWCDGVADDDCFSYGCDCFDAACYFEAHEVWERLWMRAKLADPDDEALLHGLIKLAAAGVKVLADQPAGRDAHLDGAAAHFARVQEWKRGITAEAVAEAAAALRAGGRPCLP